ncbi:MAG: SAM-dependent methyltransferase [Flavobacteriales bacterium]|nr:SAM-dependent methyltransferase [Flavobacteriales bacterium]
MKGKLYLLPCHLGDNSAHRSAVPFLIEIAQDSSHFIVENVKTARRWLKQLDRDIVIDDLTFHVLNKHTTPGELSAMLQQARDGGHVALLSEAGLPCIADPGAEIVALAHQQNIQVIPVPGPSAIILALISSGMNGQNFTFNGYLPKEQALRLKKLKELERNCRNHAHIFMETPFRSHHMLEDIINSCNASTRLCIATDITLDSEMIKTRTVGEWKKNPPALKKRLCVFVIG